MDPTFWATVGGVVVAVITLIVGFRGLKQQLRQNYMIVGSQSAIEWRTQVIALHDRGLTPGEIRYIMYLERGGAGYEYDNGSIDEIVGNIPRVIPAPGIDQQQVDHESAPRPKLPFWNGKFEADRWFDADRPSGPAQ